MVFSPEFRRRPAPHIVRAERNGKACAEGPSSSILGEAARGAARDGAGLWGCVT